MVTFKLCINLRNNSKNLAQFKKIVVSLHRETLQKLEKYDEYDRRIAETP